MKFLLSFPFIWFLTESVPFENCPNVCQQLICQSGVLSCPDGGLKQIPEMLPSGTTKVLLINHRFDSNILGFANFTKYPYSVAKLTILNCSITKIEPGTFSHLSGLQTLDLAQNMIKEIQPYTFKDLNLHFLRLDGNRGIRLQKNSFSGISSLKTISFINCDLGSLSYESFNDLSGILDKLILNQNNLRIIDSRFGNFFQNLLELELNNNPFDCSCEMKWLAKVLQHREKSIEIVSSDKKSEMILARCATPLKLTDALIRDLKDSDFLCGVPSLVELDLFLYSNDSAKISCIAANNQNSRIMWQYFDHEYYKVIPDSVTSSTNSTIWIKKKRPTDQYFCMAQNDNGNSTAEVRIKWPNIVIKTVERKIGNHSVNKEGSPPQGSFDNEFFHRRQFTLVEMIIAVVGTFTGTLMLFLLIYCCYILNMKKESRKRKLYETVLYSDSQTYDIPHQPPYYPVQVYQTSPAHYLDFKNPQVINNRQIL